LICWGFSVAISDHVELQVTVKSVALTIRYRWTFWNLYH